MHPSDRPAQTPFDSSQIINESARSTGQSQLSTSAARYWFVWVPALLLSSILVADQVAASNNERALTTTFKDVVVNHLQDQEDEKLDQTLRAHWIQLNAEDNLVGRISTIDPEVSAAIPIEKLDVNLISNGEKVRSAVSDAEGKFVLEDVEPGVYTLVASGLNGFMAYGVNVLPQVDEFNALEQDARLSPAEAKRKFLVSHFNIPDNAVIQDELQIDAAAVPPEFTTLHQITQTYVKLESAPAPDDLEADDLKAIDQATEIRGGFQFPLTFDGTFNGRVQPIATDDGRLTRLSDVNLFLIQDDLEVARTPIDENGRFSISNVEPGVYSVVAAGQDGFAAFSLELTQVAGEGDVGNLPTDSDFQLVSARPAAEAAPPVLGVALITNLADMQWISQEIDRVQQMRRALFNQDGLGQFFGQGQFFGPGAGGFPAGPAPGRFPFNASLTPPAGSGFGGGGFGGGLGAGWLILPLAFIPLAIDDDDPIRIPPPASPNVPQ